MESLLYAVALLACPVGMGLMMWFMAKGMRRDAGAEPPRVAASVEHLRDEHRRLSAELGRLEGRPAERVSRS